jgi:5-methylcytosine-specific restriction endonuclease McrA
MKSSDSTDRLDRAVARALADSGQRERGYRAQALKMYPWICGRCAREFTRANLQELTVHHRDHIHDNNPSDGSNWELLCVYCHDNEHARYVDPGYGESKQGKTNDGETHNPFADLANLLKTEKQ